MRMSMTGTRELSAAGDRAVSPMCSAFGLACAFSSTAGGHGAGETVIARFGGVNIRANWPLLELLTAIATRRCRAAGLEVMAALAGQNGVPRADGEVAPGA